MDNPLVAVLILFSLSLLAAVLLFKFFKASAVFATKRYRAGGAIAGFCIVFTLLYTSFFTLAGKRNELDRASYNEQIKQHEEEISNLKAQILRLQHRLKPLEIKGTLGGQYLKNRETKLVLAVQAADANPDGRFHLSAPGVNPDKSMVAVYVVSVNKVGGTRVDRYEVDASDNLDHWAIPRNPQ